MNKNIAHRITAFIAAVLIIPAFAVTVSAEGGNGDGTGGGKDKPLALESSSIANGEQNVSLNPEIVLTFNKNVVHFTVKENNMKCFSMTDVDGNSVPINIIMGDDQVDPSIKRIVTVIPESSLEYDTSYLLKIGKDITSKSGVSLGKDSYISFTTVKEKATTAAPSTTITKPPSANTTIKRVSAGVGYAGSSSTTKPSADTATTVAATTKPVEAKQTAAAEKIKREITHRAVSTANATSAQDGGTTVKTTTATAEKNVSNVTLTQSATQAETALQSELWSWNETAKSENTVTYSESVTQQNQSGDTSPAEESSKGVRKNLPYIITGIIAVIAVPAIALTIKKKKSNNT